MVLPGSLHLDLVAFATAIIALTWLYRRDLNRDRRRRAHFFARCMELFQSCRVTQERGDYPVMVGRYRGHDVRLEPVLDTVAWRKLPSLWLKVALVERNPVHGVFDMLIRPQGIEFYSPSGGLDARVRPPRGWPQDAIICTDDPATLPPLDRIAPHIGLFDDPKMKELVITPHGTRLVYQVWQAERAYYTVMRQVKFAEERLAPQVARFLLDSAIAISGSFTADDRQAA